MVRRIFMMATASSSRGRVTRVENVPMSKGGSGRTMASGASSKPPTGLRAVSGSLSDMELVNGVKNLHLNNSAKKSPSLTGLQSGRRQYSAGRRPITIKNLADVAALLREQMVKNVVIVAGAGISTASGIPDFRSPGTGLYSNLQQYSIPYPEAIFDIDFFHHNPRPFFTLAKELYPSGKYRPNYVHYFARLLHDRGMLLRFYTQNIDGLERIAGVPPEKLVEAHGTFSTATCVNCGQKYDGDDIKDKIFEDKLPRCKRHSCTGIVKPDIVFFGEELPKRFYYYLKDMLQTDLVLVMGTSLEVQPFAGIIDTVRFTVPRVLFNRMAVGPFRKQKRAKDFVSEGDLIEQLQEFVETIGWSEDMVNLITRMEGYFKTAFPPPTPPPSKDGDKQMAKPRLAPLSAMWRQNAFLGLSSDSDDSSDTGSQVSRSSSDTSSTESSPSPGVTRGPGGKGGVNGKGVAGKGSGGSTVSSSSSGYVSNTSSISPNSTASTSGTNINNQRRKFTTKANMSKTTDSSKGAQPNKLLGRRNSDNSGRMGGQRAYSQERVSKSPARNTGRPGVPPLVLKEGRRVAAMLGTTPKPPPASNSDRKPPGASFSERKPPIAVSRRAAHQVHRQQQQQQPARQNPGAHPIKPRSNSVNKAVPEKVHSKHSQNLKNSIPRVQSANPVRLAYRHRPSPPPYDARMMALNAGGSDSTSSDDDDFDDDRDSDDSSDDSR